VSKEDRREPIFWRRFSDGWPTRFAFPRSLRGSASQSSDEAPHRREMAQPPGVFPSRRFGGYPSSAAGESLRL